MSNINQVSLSGNLTRDGELRTTSNGAQILSLGLACNDVRRNPNTGNWDEIPNFFDLVVFGSRATGVAPYMVKGTKIAIQGKLRWSSWKAEDGTNRSKVEVVVNELEFLSKREGQQAAQQQPQVRQPAQQQMPQGQFAQAVFEQPAQPVGVYDYDVPF